MKRYLKVLIALSRFNLVRDMEYRGSFILWFGLEVVWVAIFFILVSVIYMYTDQVMGWTKAQTFVLVAMYKIIKGLFDATVFPNLKGFPEAINRGELDYVLTRPINPLFLSSLRRQYITDLFEVIVGIVFLYYSFIILGRFPSIIEIITAIISSIIGFIALYLITLIGSIVSIFTTRLTALGSYHDIVKNFLRYPSDIFSGRSISKVLIFLPLAVITTIPTKILLGQDIWTNLVWQILFVVPFSVAVYKFWTFALRHYSSASS